VQKFQNFDVLEPNLRQISNTEKGYDNPKHRTLHFLVFEKIDFFNFLRHF
jgi:hypothetical protein